MYEFQIAVISDVHGNLWALEAVLGGYRRRGRTAKLDLSMFGGSALTDMKIDVPESPTTGIPVTYVPARNTIMLSLALAWAEVLQAQDIFIGVNALDYSGYPDCRAEYVQAFQHMANLATKSAVEGKTITVYTPLD